MKLKIGQLCSSIVETFPSSRLVYLKQHAGSTRWEKQTICKTDVTLVISVQFNYKFLNFPTWSRCSIIHVYHEHIEGFNYQCANLCQNSFWRQNVPLSLTDPTVFKRSHFLYGESTRMGCLWQSKLIKPIWTTINVLEFK